MTDGTAVILVAEAGTKLEKGRHFNFDMRVVTVHDSAAFCEWAKDKNPIHISHAEAVEECKRLGRRPPPPGEVVVPGELTTMRLRQFMQGFLGPLILICKAECTIDTFLFTGEKPSCRFEVDHVIRRKGRLLLAFRFDLKVGGLRVVHGAFVVNMAA